MENARNYHSRRFSPPNSFEPDGAWEDTRMRLAYLGLCSAGEEPDEESLSNEIALLTRLGRKSSLPSRVAAAVAIPARITSSEYDEKLKRFSIAYQAPWAKPESEDEAEFIRSDRVDCPHGETVRKLWSRPELLERDVYLFKLTESDSRGKHRSAVWVSYM